MKRALTALVALALLAVPSSAGAQSGQTNAPPGNSAIDEYLETVPGAAGNALPKPPSSGGGSAASSGDATSSTLTPAQRDELARHGPDGRALADIVERTSPGTPAQQRRSEPLAGEGRSPLAEAIDVATGSDGGDGMGALLPAILLATLLGCIALVVLRRRSAS